MKMATKRSAVLPIVRTFLEVLLSIQVFFILVDWLTELSSPNSSADRPLADAREWLTDHGLLFIPPSTIGKLLLILLLLVFFSTGRNIVLFLLKKIFSFFSVLPGPRTKELFKRYLNIGRFSFYKNQLRIYGRLRSQYPADTGFVVLPMDMEYMEAGKLKEEHRYHQQMDMLKRIKLKDKYKNTFFPFVFADPRRMLEEGSKHFDYVINNGKVILQECFIKDYIETYKFSGFKIYPALGYYPFDDTLLPLWKYAADNGLPITTHCIRGIIYYRGPKQKAWDHHPIFEQASGNDKYEPLLLMEIKNRDFTTNFTHPLNYLCLLEEELLRKVVARSRNRKVHELFGYQDENTKLKHDLSHLKLCFGHFGGDDEWNRFMELDRDNYSAQLVKNPEQGVQFLSNSYGKPSRGKLEQIWKYADWYTIICSIILDVRFPNVYADISYILHKAEIQPLLKYTMRNPKLRTKVLFGTDFYVVRNHKSEKNILADMLQDLSDDDFDQIARINPRKFLANARYNLCI